MTNNRQSPVFQSGDPRYMGFFERFNRQRYHDAHAVLEPFWLEQRGRPGAPFYKGLIQIAGAFVHIQKQRFDPAERLLRLASANLRPFAPRFAKLDVARLLLMIDAFLDRLRESPGATNPLNPAHPPLLELETP